jgi:hypothetical protein
VAFKVQMNSKNAYLHPPKSVKHEVKYFDPSAAPVITSEHYNLIEGNLKDSERCEALSHKTVGELNEVDYP